MEWAIVKVLTCNRMGRHLTLRRKDADHEQDVIEAFGRMCVKPRTKYCHPV